jgi:hypothetical protein
MRFTIVEILFAVLGVESLLWELAGVPNPASNGFCRSRLIHKVVMRGLMSGSHVSRADRRQVLLFSCMNGNHIERVSSSSFFIHI